MHKNFVDTVEFALGVDFVTTTLLAKANVERLQFVSWKTLEF